MHCPFGGCSSGSLTGRRPSNFSTPLRFLPLLFHCFETTDLISDGTFFWDFTFDKEDVYMLSPSPTLPLSCQMVDNLYRATVSFLTAQAQVHRQSPPPLAVITKKEASTTVARAGRTRFSIPFKPLDLRSLNLILRRRLERASSPTVRVSPFGLDFLLPLPSWPRTHFSHPFSASSVNPLKSSDSPTPPLFTMFSQTPHIFSLLFLRQFLHKICNGTPSPSASLFLLGSVRVGPQR